MSTYSELLRDPRWQRKRLEIFSRDKWACTRCANKEEELHVHHHQYKRGKLPWEYSDSSLTTWCDTCHREFHFPSKITPSALEPKYLEGPIVGAVIPWASFEDVGIRPGDPIGWSGKTIDYPNSERNSVYVCCDAWAREFLVDAGCGRGFLFPEGVKIWQAIFFETWSPDTTPKETLEWVRLIQKMTNEGAVGGEA